MRTDRCHPHQAAVEATAALHLLLLLWDAAALHCLLLCAAYTKMHAVMRQAAGYLKNNGAEVPGAIYSVSVFLRKVQGTCVH